MHVCPKFKGKSRFWRLTEGKMEWWRHHRAQYSYIIQFHPVFPKGEVIIYVIHNNINFKAGELQIAKSIESTKKQHEQSEILVDRLNRDSYGKAGSHDPIFTQIQRTY